MKNKETALVRAFTYINKLAMDVADGFSATVSRSNLDKVQAAVKEITGGKGLKGLRGSYEIACSLLNIKREPK